MNGGDSLKHGALRQIGIHSCCKFKADRRRIDIQSRREHRDCRNALPTPLIETIFAMYSSSASQNSSFSDFNWMENTAKILNFGSPTTLILALVSVFAAIFVTAFVVAVVSIVVAKKLRQRSSGSSYAKEDQKATLLRSDSFCPASSSPHHHKPSIAGYWWDEDYSC